MTRLDGRNFNQLRETSLTPHFIKHPEGSLLIATGNTKVICNVSIEASLPPWMKSEPNCGGWITAEYAMLPRSTHTRMKRETNGLKGRTQEISRLIGRSLRAGFNLECLNGRSILVDCDVIQADGGTRTAAITGAYCAVCLALDPLVARGEVGSAVYKNQIAAVSVGMVHDQILLDLCYEEDVKADVDSNIVMTADGNLVEVQGTAEGAHFSRGDLDQMLDLGFSGIQQLCAAQKNVLASA